MDPMNDPSPNLDRWARALAKAVLRGYEFGVPMDIDVNADDFLYGELLNAMVREIVRTAYHGLLRDGPRYLVTPPPPPPGPPPPPPPPPPGSPPPPPPPPPGSPPPQE